MSGGRVLVMGILNVTPDSFHAQSCTPDLSTALARARVLVDEGADILDVGGESTRPGAIPVDAAEEAGRVVPVIRALAADFPGLTISVDTCKARVASEALHVGAALVNDVSGGRLDPAMAELVGRTGARVVLGHMRGTPATMQDAPRYDDAVAEVASELGAAVDAFLRAGVPRERIWVDPGFGFGKRLADNVALLACLDRFRDLGAGVVVGLSRKRFIGDLMRPGGSSAPEERLAGSLAAAVIAATKGASVVRTHDVRATREALAVAAAIAACGAEA